MGTFPTKAQAVAWVENHLVCSEYHKYADAKAKEEASKAESVQEWSDEEPINPPVAAAASSGGSSKGGGKKGLQTTAKALAAPPVPQIDTQALVSQVASQLLQLQADEGYWETAAVASSGSTDIVVANEAAQSWTRAIASLTRCEEALKTAARFSRQAVQAFDEEAHTIRRELEYLTTLTPQ